MNSIILLTIFAALTLLVGLVEVNVFAQNITQETNQTGENTHATINETDEASGNVTEGLVGVANGTGEAAGNITEGLGDAVNETGEAFSNTTKGALEGIQDVVNGSSQ